MASRLPNERPEVGDNLLVVHDFIARSSDELSLTKGDRVELIERDDEFGDGWFLGKHLANGNTGLFPEVYTKVSPKTPLPMAGSAAAAAPTPLITLEEETSEKPAVAVNDEQPALRSHPSHEQPSQPDPISFPSQQEPITLPLNSNKSDSTPPPTQTNQGHVAAALGRLSGPSVPAPQQQQDSQVLNDTLNVINEHITNLRSPASNSALRPGGADSGSEYSASLHHRMSYIQGEETDEEEDSTHTRAEVEAWTADDVAEFLFTSGVEKSHCEVFRDQDISGEVLLGMDQGSLFIKDFELGSVGRRLKTWHRIKALQDEVSDGITTRRTTQTYGSDVASEDSPRGRVRTSTSTMTNSISNPGNRRLSSNNTPPMLTPISASSGQNSPLHPGHFKRPSAASIRDMNHSRRHSSTDYHTGATTPRLTPNGTFPGAESAHKKQASFDRNWTLGGARPLSQVAVPGLNGKPEPGLQDSAVDMDRGYFSGNDADGKRRSVRNTLRKRDSVAHSRKSSYAEEQRVRSATALSRHSRFGSDSYRDSAPQTASQKYYGLQAAPHRRTASHNTTESIRPPPPAKDPTPPTVTRLDASRGSDESAAPPPPEKDGAWLSSLVSRPIAKTGAFGIRAISDNLGFDRKKNSRDIKDPLPSPAPTGSSTPSGGPSLDLDSPDATKSPGSNSMPASKNKGRKGKKDTSAYTRGLLKISPKEAMKGADYSGWMRKKSSNLMTTWKPRFFVLKGRRMAYYYSEDDDSEKGLIDISFHRVLPADNEKLTGLHASITGVVGGQSIMPGSNNSNLDKGDDAMFIFKLMPPRAGLSRGVHFTKPTVHYFAVPNLQQGRLWMAALMKATIDRDDTQPITSTYQQKTISLTKAKQQRHRPPALMNDLDEAAEDEQATPSETEKKDINGLGIFSEVDSGVAGVDQGSSQASSSQQTTHVQPSQESPSFPIQGA